MSKQKMTPEETTKKAKELIAKYKTMKPLLEKLFSPENMNGNSLLLSKMTQILEEEKVPENLRKKILERVEKEIMGIVR